MEINNDFVPISQKFLGLAGSLSPCPAAFRNVLFQDFESFAKPEIIRRGEVGLSVALFLLWHLVITIGVPLSAVILDRDDVSGREPVTVALPGWLIPGKSSQTWHTACL